MRTYLAGALLALLTLTGCSTEPPPSETAPELATRLERVDAAVEAEDYAQARTAVDALVAATAKAQVAGRITDDQADRILDAAREVLARLPDAEPDPERTEPTSPATTAPSSPFVPDQSGGSDDEDRGDDDDDDDKDDEKKDDGKGKGRGKDD